MDLLSSAGDLLVAALLFFGGLLAPSLRTWFEMDVLGARRERRQGANSRAIAATQECLAALNTLQDAVPAYARYSAGTASAAVHERAAGRDSALGKLEANLPLLPGEVQPPMENLLDLLRHAQDIEKENDYAPEGFHPDAVTTITRTVVAYARLVLTAGMNGAKTPPQPAPIAEYLLALKDFEEYIEEDYRVEATQHDSAIRAWRAAHNLDPARPIA